MTEDAKSLTEPLGATFSDLISEVADEHPIPLILAWIFMVWRVSLICLSPYLAAKERELTKRKKHILDHKLAIETLKLQQAQLNKKETLGDL